MFRRLSPVLRNADCSTGYNGNTGSCWVAFVQVRVVRWMRKLRVESFACMTKGQAVTDRGLAWSGNKPAVRMMGGKRSFADRVASVMLLSCKRPVTTEELLEPLFKRTRHDVFMAGPEEHALTAAQEASACDADFVEAAAAAIEEAEYRRMPDDVQDQPALKRLRGMIEGPSSTAASSNEGGVNKDEALVRQWAEDLVKSLHGCPSVEQAVQRCSAALTGFGSEDAIIIFALFQFFCVMNSRSILQCLAAWKRVSSDMLEIYGDFAVVQPVLAKSLTSGVAYVLGDLIAQRVEGQPVINVGRCTHNGITGLILHGPILHFWILFLEGRRGTAHARPFSHLFSNGDCLLAVLAKVAMDQTLFSATLNAAYALLLGILAGKTLEESMSHMRRTVPPAMFSSWRFWPIVHLVTYSSFMPIQFKVLWNDIAEVVWVAILSYIANVKAMNLNISEGPSGKQGKVSLRNVYAEDGDSVQATAVHESCRHNPAEELREELRPNAVEAEATCSRLQHTNKVHHLAGRCRKLEGSSSEVQSLRQALEQSQETQRKLQHSNQVLQEHLKVHLNVCHLA
eukprot:s932_g3.t1